MDLSEDPSNYILDIENSYLFNWLNITEEDSKRTESYKINKQIEENLSQEMDLNKYLKSLKMEVSIDEVQEDNVERVVQLINKTNQFNTVGFRTNEAEMLKYIKNPDISVLGIKLKDRYVNYGLVSVCICRMEGDKCQIIAWVMSCRVFKRKLEDYIINYIVTKLREKNKTKLNVEYRPTERNSMIESIFEKIGLKIDLFSLENDKKIYTIENINNVSVKDEINMVYGERKI